MAFTLDELITYLVAERETTVLLLMEKAGDLSKWQDNINFALNVLFESGAINAQGFKKGMDCFFTGKIPTMNSPVAHEEPVVVSAPAVEEPAQEEVLAESEPIVVAPEEPLAEVAGDTLEISDGPMTLVEGGSASTPATPRRRGPDQSPRVGRLTREHFVFVKMAEVHKLHPNATGKLVCISGTSVGRIREVLGFPSFPKNSRKNIPIPEDLVIAGKAFDEVVRAGRGTKLPPEQDEKLRATPGGTR